jgi:hypothetical protein
MYFTQVNLKLSISNLVKTLVDLLRVRAHALAMASPKRRTEPERHQ